MTTAPQGGSREVSLGKNAELRADAVANTRPDRRIWASLPLTSSPTGSHAFTALRFRSVRHCTLDFHRTLPRGPPPSRSPCLRPCCASRSFPTVRSTTLRGARRRFRRPPRRFLGGRGTQRPCHFGEGFPPSGSPEDLIYIFAPPVLRSCQSHQAFGLHTACAPKLGLLPRRCSHTNHVTAAGIHASRRIRSSAVLGSALAGTLVARVLPGSDCVSVRQRTTSPIKWGD
jgi:hypothetical protein